MIRSIARRLQHLEVRANATAKTKLFSVRIRLVHPEKGVTGVLLLETGKPTTRVPATPEDEASVRESLTRHRAASGTATDIRH